MHMAQKSKKYFFKAGPNMLWLIELKKNMSITRELKYLEQKAGASFLPIEENKEQVLAIKKCYWSLVTSFVIQH